MMCDILFCINHIGSSANPNPSPVYNEHFLVNPLGIFIIQFSSDMQMEEMLIP